MRSIDTNNLVLVREVDPFVLLCMSKNKTKENRKYAHLLQKIALHCKFLMPADGWKVVVREVENTLFFSKVVTFLCVIDADNWEWESQTHYSY